VDGGGSVAGSGGEEVDWTALRVAAQDVMRRAYAPYSSFPVGAAGIALTPDGARRVVIGCNVENASYGVGLCAECGLASNLHSTGGGRLVAVSIVGGDGEPLAPCGRCRQVLYEAGGAGLLVETAQGIVPLRDLLPGAFGPADLQAAAQRH
jgi:cytidine deaminase